MKQTTKYVLGIATATALIIGASSGVFARGGFGPGWGGHHGMMGGPGGMRGGPGMMMGGDPVAFTDQRITRLKTSLGIAPEQESAWNAYAQALKSKASMMAAHRQARFSGDFTPEQRLSFHQEGLAQMQKLSEAGSGLYAALTPQQQARFGNLVGRNCRRW